MEDFISEYLAYTQNNEAPAMYHRWSIITAMSAYLERDYYIKQGHFNIYPNLYTILIGGPGTKKNTAINITKKLLRKANYSTFAASKTTKEKLFIDMAEQSSVGQKVDELLDSNLFGDMANDSSSVHRIFIASGEFETFFGNNILDFLKDLGELWDYDGPFESKVKNGKSVIVHNPTISILGGITPASLADTFPPQMIGQGFFSRCLFIYGEKTRDKITFQPDEDELWTASLVSRLKEMKPPVPLRVSFTPAAEKLLDKIYKSPEVIQDVRFESYYNRRLAQLLKLSLICMCSLGEQEITEQVVVYANTMLTYVENFMPKALGEFGKSKNSDISHKIVQLLENHVGIMDFKKIWRYVNNDLEKMSDLATILQNLTAAEKIQAVPQGLGFLPNRRVIEHLDSATLDYSFLTEEEKKVSQ